MLLLLLTVMLAVITVSGTLTPLILVIATNLGVHLKTAPDVPGHEFEVWGYLYGGKVRLVTCVLYSLLEKGLISIDKRFVYLGLDHQSKSFRLSSSENLVLGLIQQEQPYKLYQIYPDDRFRQHISGIHQTLKSEGLFYELPKPIRIGGVLLSWFPLIGYPVLLILALFAMPQIMSPLVANNVYFVAFFTASLVAWNLFYSFTLILHVLNYKKRVSNVDLGKIAKKDGTEFTVKEREIIAHGLPQVEKPLKQLVSRNSGALGGRTWYVNLPPKTQQGSKD